MDSNAGDSHPSAIARTSRGRRLGPADASFPFVVVILFPGLAPVRCLQLGPGVEIGTGIGRIDLLLDDPLLLILGILADHDSFLSVSTATLAEIAATLGCDVTQTSSSKVFVAVHPGIAWIDRYPDRHSDPCWWGVGLGMFARGLTLLVIGTVALAVRHIVVMLFRLDMAPIQPALIRMTRFVSVRQDFLARQFHDHVGEHAAGAVALALIVLARRISCCLRSPFPILLFVSVMAQPNRRAR